MTLPIAFDGQVQLLDWSETAKGGAKIVLQLDGPEALEPFRSMTLAKRGAAGQRLAAVFVVVDDDEKPVAVERPKGGPLAKLAGQWCADVRFQNWIGTMYGNISEGSNPSEAVARDVLCDVCRIESRAELDHDAQARQRFNEYIREPYRKHAGAA